MSLPRYPAYRDSGVDWLGTVPSHWQVDRLKAAITSCKNGIWGEEPKGDDSDIDCVRVADFDRARLVVDGVVPTQRSVTQSERAGRTLQRDNLLLEKSGGGERQPVGQVVLYDRDEPAVCSNFVAKVTLAEGMAPRFWMYQHAAAYAYGVNIVAIKQTSGIQNLDQSQYFNERGVFPSYAEQVQIARFLDRETAKIDALIAEQEKLLALLAEKRQATISHAVTRGLSPNAPMKDSGIPWLGEVPVHWEVRRLRFVADISTGDADTADAAEDGRYPFFVRSPNVERIDRYTHDCEAVLTAGDGAGVGKVFHHFDGKFCAHQRVYVFTNFRDVSGGWFFSYLKALFYRVVLEGTAKSTVDSLRRPMIADFPITIPTTSEMAAIEAHIQEQTTKFDRLISAAEAAVRLLEQRRSALIAAAVTGQVDVRGAVEREAA